MSSGAPVRPYCPQARAAPDSTIPIPYNPDRNMAIVSLVTGLQSRRGGHRKTSKHTSPVETSSPVAEPVRRKHREHRKSAPPPPCSRENSHRFSHRKQDPSPQQPRRPPTFRSRQNRHTRSGSSRSGQEPPRGEKSYASDSSSRRETDAVAARVGRAAFSAIGGRFRLSARMRRPLPVCAPGRARNLVSHAPPLTGSAGSLFPPLSEGGHSACTERFHATRPVALRFRKKPNSLFFFLRLHCISHMHTFFLNYFGISTILNYTRSNAIIPLVFPSFPPRSEQSVVREEVSCPIAGGRSLRSL